MLQRYIFYSEMPPGHKKVLRCAHSGVGGHISGGKRARRGEIQPPEHKKVLGCAHSGVGGHIFRGKRARRGEMQPPGHKKRPGASAPGLLGISWGEDYSHSIVAFGFGDMS